MDKDEEWWFGKDVIKSSTKHKEVWPVDDTEEVDKSLTVYSSQETDGEVILVESDTDNFPKTRFWDRVITGIEEILIVALVA